MRSNPQSAIEASGRRYVDTGICIGGPLDRIQKATEPGRREIVTPVAAESLDAASMEIRNHHYRREMIGAGDEVYGVWVHESLPAECFVKALLLGYAQR